MKKMISSIKYPQYYHNVLNPISVFASILAAEVIMMQFPSVTVTGITSE